MPLFDELATALHKHVCVIAKVMLKRDHLRKPLADYAMSEAEPNLNVAHALWYAAAQQLDVRETVVSAPLTDQALVQMLCSAVSRGTESLIFAGQVPVSEYDRMKAPLQEGAFPFPVKYGYSGVGLVREGPPELVGKRVFCLHPHQSQFVVETAWLVEVPDNVPSKRATLAANMETALNAVWDGQAGPGDRIAVVGGGLVGALIAWLCASLPGAQVTLFDVRDDVQNRAQALGCAFVKASDTIKTAELNGHFDLIFHTSANGEGLQTALQLAGFESRVVEVSWYGERQLTVNLGASFHSQRLQLISSQVGSVASNRRARWSHRRRLTAALALLDDDRLDALITHDIPFDEAPTQLTPLLTGATNGCGIVLSYPS